MEFAQCRMEAAARGLTLAPRAIIDRLAAFQNALGTDGYVAMAADLYQISALHQADARAERRGHIRDTLGTWFGRTFGHAHRLRRQLRDMVAPSCVPQISVLASR